MANERLRTPPDPLGSIRDEIRERMFKANLQASLEQSNRVGADAARANLLKRAEAAERERDEARRLAEDMVLGRADCGRVELPWMSPWKQP